MNVKVVTNRYLQSMRLGPYRYQIGNKTRFIQKLGHFMLKIDVYVNRLESVIFGI